MANSFHITLVTNSWLQFNQRFESQPDSLYSFWYCLEHHLEVHSEEIHWMTGLRIYYFLEGFTPQRHALWISLLTLILMVQDFVVCCPSSTNWVSSLMKFYLQSWPCHLVRTLVLSDFIDTKMGSHILLGYLTRDEGYFGFEIRSYLGWVMTQSPAICSSDKYHLNLFGTNPTRKFALWVPPPDSGSVSFSSLIY